MLKLLEIPIPCLKFRHWRNKEAILFTFVSNDEHDSMPGGIGVNAWCMPCMCFGQVIWQTNVPLCSKKCTKINTLGLRMAGSGKAMSPHEIGCSSCVAFLGGCKINHRYIQISYKSYNWYCCLLILIELLSLIDSWFQTPTSHPSILRGTIRTSWDEPPGSLSQGTHGNIQSHGSCSWLSDI